MNHEHEPHRTGLSTRTQAREDASEPGQSSRSARLDAPARPIASGLIQRKPRGADGVAGDAEQAVAAASSSSGSALPDPLIGKFEASLGASLSSVRVHTDGASANAAHAVGARAYTVGQDIHFAAGQYDPASRAGQHLLAHEVAHTVQQRGGATARQNKLEVSAPHDPAEHEADRAADAMVAGQPAVVAAAHDLQRTIARDVDRDMQAAGAAGADAGASDAKVQVIMGHTVTADQNEAQAIISRIAAAEDMVSRHPKATVSAGPGGLGPMKGILAENHDARFVLEHYMATVSESGNSQSEYAASYMNTKRDYGEFMGLYHAFEAAGGALKAGSQTNKMAELSKDPEFLRARGKFEGVRDQLKTDKNKISEGQIAAESAQSALQEATYNARAVAARATATKKQNELNKVIKSIDEAVSTIMTVAKMASAATTGVIALGSGGMDISKLVESNPEIAPGNAPAGGAPTLAPPDVRRFSAPGTGPNPAPALPEDGLGKPNDTRTYAMPSQTIDNAKGLADKGLNLAGGPDKLLKSAITMLEQANIDRIQSEIDAANEDGNLNDAAAAAAHMREKRLAFQEKITVLADNVGNLMDHKKQMDTAVSAMVAAAKQHGGGKDLTGAIRLVGAGDKFLSQVDLTIALAEKQQEKGAQARQQRYDINSEAFSSGTAQGPGQLHYWTVDKKDKSDFVATKQMVELKASGQDSLVSGASNSTQFDVGKSLEELRDWKKDVEAKRNQAEGALGIGAAAGQSSN